LLEVVIKALGLGGLLAKISAMSHIERFKCGQPSMSLA